MLMLMYAPLYQFMEDGHSITRYESWAPCGVVRLEIMKMEFYKVLNVDGSCYHGGVGSWLLPVGGEPGAWMPEIVGELKPCARGYHVLKLDQLVRWLGPAIFKVEVAGTGIEQSDKYVYRKARLLRKLEPWNAKSARLFACDCAEHVLPIFESAFPNDKRPHTAIEVARKFANGEATQQELNAAASDAFDAARFAASGAFDAARDAARATRDAARAADDAFDAARDAARFAARGAFDAASFAAAAADAADAARDAARATRDAARAAEIQWQPALLARIIELKD